MERFRFQNNAVMRRTRWGSTAIMMGRTLVALLLMINWLFIQSCSMINSGEPLPGEIVVSSPQKHEYSIYVDSDMPTTTFKLNYGNEIQFSWVEWLNTKDAFVGTEGVCGLTGVEYRCNIVRFDSVGEITDRIYEAGKGELASPRNLSWDDKYLLFAIERESDPIKYPFEGLAPMVSLAVMDLEQKKVIVKLDSVGRFPNLQIEESPWLHEGYRFVYSIYGGTKFKLEGQEELINPVKTTEGVYLFDVLTDEHRLLVSRGYSAIASPISDQIAYKKDNSLRVLDLKTNKEKIFYKHSPKEKIRNMHWTPDGKSVYFAYTYYSEIADILNSNGEKLIDVKTGKEKPFKRIGHGFRSYTWK